MDAKQKKNLIFLVKLLIVAAVAAWIVMELRKSWNKIDFNAWTFHYDWLLFSGVLYAVAYVPPALFWRYAMRTLGQSPGLYETFRAYYIGHLGKYVPGKAMVVILRSGLLRHDRTRASIAAAAVFLETLTMMAAGAFLSALILLIRFRDMPNGGWLTLLAIGMMVVSGLPVLPPVFRMMALRVGIGRNDPEIIHKLNGLNLQTLVTGWVLTTFCWILLGLSLWATVRGIGIETGPLSGCLLRFILAASLSVVLGFVTMIPGGIFVREFAMAQVLIAYFADLLMEAQGMPYQDALAVATTQAIAVAAVQRGISILAELTVSTLLFKSPGQASSQPIVESDHPVP